MSLKGQASYSSAPNDNARLQDEAGRLAALARYQILDSDFEHEFADICGLVKSIFRVRYVAVNLIDSHRQWNKVAIGLASCTAPRNETFCDHTIRTASPLAVEDATQDERFAHLPFVQGDIKVRSYLGVPLTSPDGYNVGALCVFDNEPRIFTEADAEILRNFAKVVIGQMELRLIARDDELTGAQSNRAFAESMEQATQGHIEATLLVLDLDHFKEINDAFGHAVGDMVLRRIAARIRETLRKSDAFGRLGGEEFGILLKGSDALGGATYAQRLCKEIAQLDIPEIGERKITLSIGISQMRRLEPRTNWMSRAMSALYTAKREGRNRFYLAAALPSAEM